MAYRMLIDGRLVTSEETIPVINPANGEIFAVAPDCSEAQLNDAVVAGRRAFGGWRDTPINVRQELLRRAADIIERNIDLLAPLLTREQGRPVDGARSEIANAVRWIRACAEMEPPHHVVDEGDGQRIEVRYVPLGVVCAISPWNFPVSLSVWKMAPALLVGNCVVLKPSPFTPLAMLEIARLIADVFPAGVLNIISGGDELGPRMTAHPGFDKISFTGSTATGKRVMEAASRGLKRLTLELGGNDAAIVLPDADVDSVAAKIFAGAFYNSAQICVATKRLFVHDQIYDALRDRLVDIAATARLGDGLSEGTTLGPLQNRRQFDRVKSLVEEAKAEGLTVIEGPSGPSEGYFIPVTIIDNPPEDARTVQEEAFGPVLPMLRFTDIDDVIERVNASEYGLAGAVWSANVQTAVSVARRLETGTVWINHNLALRPDVPFAGQKQSGFGVENGIDGLLEYMTPQSIYVPA